MPDSLFRHLTKVIIVVALALPGDARLWLGAAASQVAANADTWATELGVLRPGSPRLITKRLGQSGLYLIGSSVGGDDLFYFLTGLVPG